MEVPGAGPGVVESMLQLSVRYDAEWVVASVAISATAAYLALTLVDRMRAAGADAHRLFWRIAGAVAMGGGIWSMHYLGMLAVQLPFPVFYDWRVVAFSALIAMVTSDVVLERIGSGGSSPGHTLATAGWMAAGVGAMHYTGMAAMRSRAMEVYAPSLVVLSLVAALAFAWASLTIAVRAGLGRQRYRLPWRITSAIAMGIGVAAMHYTAMATVTFHDMGVEPSLAHTVVVGTLGRAGLALVTLLVLGVALTGAWLDERRIERLSEFNAKLRQAHEQLRESHRELREAHDELHHTHQRLHDAHEQLYNSNLQLQILNDELRRTNEDLEQTQEELLKTQAQLCEMNADLGDLSTRDSLTGVHNRRHFDHSVNTEVRRAARRNGPIALLMVDIDHFKELNDTFGHQYGDICLKRVAEILASVPKRGYDVVARYGGEEFAVLMPEARTEGAARAAETIRRRVQQMELPVPEGHTQAPAVTVSVGVCMCWPRIGEATDHLVQEADKALYRAKHLGRNRVEVASVLEVDSAAGSANALAVESATETASA